MLSIRSAEGNEWWVSGAIFDRLLQTAIKNTLRPAELESWWHMANANGGLDLSLLETSESDELLNVLFKTADDEIARLAQMELAPEDAAYKAGLANLLKLRPAIPVRPSSRSA